MPRTPDIYSSVFLLDSTSHIGNLVSRVASTLLRTKVLCRLLRGMSVLLLLIWVDGSLMKGQVPGVTTTLPRVVKDDAGAPVSKRYVVVLGFPQSFLRASKTNEQGLFNVVLLPRGSYKVKDRYDDFALMSGQRRTKNLLSVDTLQEFRIFTSTYAPELGPTPGSQNSHITRSGSNDFRGNLFGYFRNASCLLYRPTLGLQSYESRLNALIATMTFWKWIALVGFLIALIGGLNAILSLRSRYKDWKGTRTRKQFEERLEELQEQFKRVEAFSQKPRAYFLYVITQILSVVLLCMMSLIVLLTAFILYILSADTFNPLYKIGSIVLVAIAVVLTSVAARSTVSLYRLARRVENPKIFLRELKEFLKTTTDKGLTS